MGVEWRYCEECGEKKWVCEGYCVECHTYLGEEIEDDRKEV